MKTILVVDDEFGIVDALRLLLEDQGYRVVSAVNGREGLALLEKHHPDLALLDVMMPVLGGQQMLSIMRSQRGYDAIPVIMMSAAPETAAAAKSELSGQASAFLQKPFNIQQLLRMIRDLVGPDVK